MRQEIHNDGCRQIEKVSKENHLIKEMGDKEQEYFYVLLKETENILCKDVDTNITLKWIERYMRYKNINWYLEKLLEREK